MLKYLLIALAAAAFAGGIDAALMHATPATA